MDWNTINLATLERLRKTFLSADSSAGNYWRKWDDLENYDFVYARRIGWKWDAVLSDLKRLGWTPPPGVLLDWGCGTGIATRRFLENFGPSSIREIRVHDRSQIAMRFAGEAIRRSTGRLKVGAATHETLTSRKPVGLLLISHVLNELDAPGLAELEKLCQRAKAIIWVEPGSHTESRALIELREKLRGDFRVIAPCCHANRCEMMSSANERHWCHFFAEPPRDILGNAAWTQFSREMRIDLRSLPYSYLVLQHRKVKATTELRDLSGVTRVIGRPRVYKPMAKAFCCDEKGLIDREAQKRDAGEFYKVCKKKESKTLYRFDLDGERIVGAHEPLPESAG